MKRHSILAGMAMTVGWHAPAWSAPPASKNTNSKIVDAAPPVAQPQSSKAADPPRSGVSSPTATRKVTTFADLSLRFQEGKVQIERVERGAFPAPTALRRFVGRFEARVLVAGKPVESVRFDFPLLGEADVGSEPAMAERLLAHVVASARVRVPLADGAEAIEVIDRLDHRKDHVLASVQLLGPARPPASGTAARPAAEAPSDRR